MKEKILKIGEFDSNGWPEGWDFEGTDLYIYLPSGTYDGSNGLPKEAQFCGYTIEELRQIKEANNPLLSEKPLLA